VAGCSGGSRSVWRWVEGAHLFHVAGRDPLPRHGLLCIHAGWCGGGALGALYGGVVAFSSGCSGGGAPGRTGGGSTCGCRSLVCGVSSIRGGGRERVSFVGDLGWGGARAGGWVFFVVVWCWSWGGQVDLRQIMGGSGAVGVGRAVWGGVGGGAQHGGRGGGGCVVFGFWAGSGWVATRNEQTCAWRCGGQVAFFSGCYGVLFWGQMGGGCCETCYLFGVELNGTPGWKRSVAVVATSGGVGGGPGIYPFSGCWVSMCCLLGFFGNLRS